MDPAKAAPIVPHANGSLVSPQNDSGTFGINSLTVAQQTAPLQHSDGKQDSSGVARTVMREPQSEEQSASPNETTPAVSGGRAPLFDAIRRWEEKHSDKAYSLHTKGAKGKVKSLEQLGLVDNEAGNGDLSPDRGQRPGFFNGWSRTSPRGSPRKAKKVVPDEEAETERHKLPSPAPTPEGLGRRKATLLSVSNGDELAPPSSTGSGRSSRRGSALISIRNFLGLEVGRRLDGDNKSRATSREGSKSGYYQLDSGGTPFDGAFTSHFDALVRFVILTSRYTVDGNYSVLLVLLLLSSQCAVCSECGRQQISHGMSVLQSVYHYVTINGLMPQEL